ncbi:hypothetical protein DM872_26555 [Pseudomonas taiwanensis]|uniref:DUF1998 domain-containing protein n=1 Tax=Pseudomonas taiwanensis TaxID=470150 RepID=UPI0015BF9A4E|nr:DUF1998 domain-containing protein [Pseudomonas taiwanensis]NWL80417.1 hypothetical protein [Pseudomonas taiwanensis]
MKREIRSSAVAGMAGVGAVIDVGQESFLIPGIDLWKQAQLRVIDLRRLSSRLHKVLKAPKEENPTLMVRRFPRAMFCEKCRSLTSWRTDMEKEASEPVCPSNSCGGKLVPMRFVAACENGHLDDIDWGFWAHSGNHGAKGGCKVRNRLHFVVDVKAATGGLASLRVECKDCGSSRTLEDLASKVIVKEMFRNCTGRHPWIFGKQEECTADVVVLQRGATNLHYPSTISALDIPADVVENPAVEFAEQVKQHPRYQKVLSLIRDTEGDNGDYIEEVVGFMADAVGCDPSVVLDVLQADADGRPLVAGNTASQEAVIDQELLLDEEWRTIEKALHDGELVSQNFSAVREAIAQSAPKWMKQLIGGVLLIRRLREVRAYLGFQRVKPGTPDKTVRPDVGANERWLPAAEVFGEGIVLALDFDMLENWASSIPEGEQNVLGALEQKRLDENFWFLPRVDPVFLSIHTLTHLLLRRITFECGYSSSSLRERLYFNREKRYAAIMIFTADGDSEGSLGGLVRQGREDRLAQSIIEALDQGRWCSADPVCSETAGQGLGGFNHAACHACSLVSETSCVSANTLLDRRMLFDPVWGLLKYMESSK